MCQNATNIIAQIIRINPLLAMIYADLTNLIQEISKVWIQMECLVVYDAADLCLAVLKRPLRMPSNASMEI
jgi:hypothetical protein